MKKHLVLPSFVFLLFIAYCSLSIVHFSPVYAQTENPWPMVAGNPQRTSWSPDQFSTGNAVVEWYHPIDAYISPNFQVIAANNLVYVSSARGLYAFQYDTGVLAWRYDTEIPLGNSPTIATVNGISMAFVGGYDKKLHAFNATTGQLLWEFSGAKAGYNANPLVINNIVYIGNRDGYFYAVNATNGSLIWQYPPANQDQIGPIKLSPAYKNNTLYFATDYNYGYALNMDGTLKWKSQKLRGDGYQSYWPVIYTDPSTNKDYVIFSGKIPYREAMRPGTQSLNFTSYYMYVDFTGAFPQSVTLSDSWAQGKTVLDYSVVANFLNQKPHLKIYTILDGVSGIESVTLPDIPQYNPNTQAPPVVSNDLLFIDNDRGNDTHHIMGWKFGTNYFADTALGGARDEPLIISGGGNNIYKVLCCSRSGTYSSLPNLTNQSNLWPYGGNSLSWVANAEGYDTKEYYLDPTNPLDNITVIFGTVNGIYGYHGDGNPLVPYKGKLYTIKGNSIMAWGTAGNKCPNARTTTDHCFPLVTFNPAPKTVTVPSDAEFKSKLEKEIQKIVDAGILKPGYQDDSQFGFSYYLLDNYFDNPGDTLYTLSIAYPYLSPTLQTQVKSYLNNGTNGIYDLYFKNGFTNRIGWARGAQRDSILYPPDLAADMLTLSDDYNWLLDGSLSWNYGAYINVNPNSFYALWKYAQVVSPENVQSIYTLALNKIGFTWWGGSGGTLVSPSATDDYLINHPYELNAYIAGYYGFLKLQELAGKTVTDASVRNAITTTYNHLHDLRLNNFSKDTPFNTYSNGYGKNFLNISRNFIWLTPELAADLRTSKLSQIQTALDEYNTVGSYWFVSKFNAAAAESGLQNLYDYPSNFQARAWILKASKEELTKYLDVPAFEKGDLFYIQNLVAVIEAPFSGASPTNSPPTPTTSPACSSDINHDHTVNQADLLLILSNFGSNNSLYDINSDSKVNMQDAVYVIKNWGGSC